MRKLTPNQVQTKSKNFINQMIRNIETGGGGLEYVTEEMQDDGLDKESIKRVKDEINRRLGIAVMLKPR